MAKSREKTGPRKNGAKSKNSTPTKTLQSPSAEEIADDRATQYDFIDRWQNREKPKWHPVKKMRYVFWRMIHGIMVVDAVKEIHWDLAEFWHHVDLKRNAPFLVEYKRAKQLQGRAMADAVLQIAEGRDAITRKNLRAMKKVIQRELRRSRTQKSSFAAKTILESLIAQMDANDSKVLQRNKIQIDAAKWIAKTANPNEFGEKSALSLNPDMEHGLSHSSVLIEFVGPDGQRVAPSWRDVLHEERA